MNEIDRLRALASADAGEAEPRVDVTARVLDAIAARRAAEAGAVPSAWLVSAAGVALAVAGAAAVAGWQAWASCADPLHGLFAWTGGGA